MRVDAPRVARWLGCLIISSLCLGGCLPEDPDANRADAAGPALPPARVDLPAPVKLEGTIPPETHQDGKMRVDGLMARKKKYLGQKVIVRGFVVEKYTCPEEAKRCEQPHAFIADTPAGGDKRLLVTRLSEDRVGRLEVGQAYVIMGEFATKSSEGFVASMGLLAHESIEGFESVDEENERLEKEKSKTRRRRR